MLTREPTNFMKWDLETPLKEVEQHKKIVSDMLSSDISTEHKRRNSELLMLSGAPRARLRFKLMHGFIDVNAANPATLQYGVPSRK